MPRIARLLVQAHHIQELVDSGQVRDLAEVARRGHITRSRTSQIMNLLYLAPKIQEAVLFLPKISAGRDPITERDLRPLCNVLDWRRQSKLWGELKKRV